MDVRRVRPSDGPAWIRMRTALWPSEPDDHAREVARFFAGDRSEPAEVLLAFADDGEPVGFAELSIRPYAAGCDSGRVAYLEGWYVMAARRRHGVGRALVRAAEDWGRMQGCSELASDTELHNTDSARAHEAVGFSEVERIVCFRKPL